nr:hypothetical protein [Trueperella sp. HMSC08H06]
MYRPQWAHVLQAILVCVFGARSSGVSPAHIPAVGWQSLVSIAFIVSRHSERNGHWEQTFFALAVFSAVAEKKIWSAMAGGRLAHAGCGS